MRTITAPGVEIKEIDKSQYSPAMVGTACYIMGFANKGEAYQPQEFTNRSSWISYYGEPDNEAERYFYNACIEVLNQNGRLYCARLPYDNPSFEKMVACKYSLGDIKSIKEIDEANSNSAEQYLKHNRYEDLSAADASIINGCEIDSSESPYLMTTTDVEMYKADEVKPGTDTFIIVDKTCGTYTKIPEDSRKGIDREFIGIVPIITTAANALYAQKMISVENRFACWYESAGKLNVQLKTNGGIEQGSILSVLPINTDLVRQINSVYKNYQPRLDANGRSVNTITIGDMYETLLDALTKDYTNTDSYTELAQDIQTIETWPEKLNEECDKLIAVWNNDPILKNDISLLTDLKISDTSTLIIGTLKDKIEKLYQYVYTTAGYHAEDGDDNLPNTVSFEANEYFSTISFNTDLQAFDRDNLKKIGVVVFKAYLDPAEGNKVQFQAVESFCGSLYKDDKDPTTGVTTFLDTLINDQSNYIYFFSNCFNTPAKRKQYLGTSTEANLDIMLTKPTDNGATLGFFEKQVEEKISVAKSILEGMNKCFDKVADVNERDIDIVPDAGLANIASFIKTIYGSSGLYDMNAMDDQGNSLLSKWKCDGNNTAVKTWKTVEQKLDDFCKKTRKDCMFIADGLRPLVIQGQKKVIRPSNPNNTIDLNILPYVKYLMGLNTNYGAGYLDWFEITDDYSGDQFWCPPSIKAMGAYIYTDVNFNYWDAPAGLTRGIIAATDVAFSPTAKQAGVIYEKNWNYSINYPYDGIVLEGQKTFQIKPTAFDRVNVRRLFLRLERQAYKVARYFVYEGNTAYTRQRLVDALDPYFREAKVGGGIYDYLIRCNEQNNTPEVIDRNELKVQIGIKPVKTAEFILIDFIALTTGGSFEEAFT